MISITLPKLPRDFFDSTITSKMMRAVMLNYPRGVEAAVNEGADPNIVGRDGIMTPLLFAVSFYPHNIKATQALLDEGADPNYVYSSDPSISVMGKAIQYPDGKLLRLLLDYGGDPQLLHGSYSLVREASSCGCWDNVKKLVDHGADINERIYSDRTLLLQTVNRHNWEQAIELLHLGADPCACDNDGECVIDYARDHQEKAGQGRDTQYQLYIQFMQLLTEANSDI